MNQVQFKINGQQISFKGITDKIIVDSVIQDCYDDAENNLNQSMSGEFLKLKPGENVIEWSGNVTKVELGQLKDSISNQLDTADIKTTIDDLRINILAKLKLISSIDAEKANKEKIEPVGKDINDLKFVADIIIASGKRLVIEDFHYLSIKERENFAFEPKALWDYGCFVVIIGVWSQSNSWRYI